ncbi:hypothetical protein J2T47_005858, partial [Pseudomonas nitroreducens]|nr:hypothetical protein [Pseudomonas nitroreducens]
MNCLRSNGPTFPRAKAKPPASDADQGSWDRSLTMTYSHMEKLH